MKFNHLDLIAFGPFTQRRLALDCGPRLNLVYGPNEAGKSSALRGLACLLFGIPHATNDNFVHPNTAIRVGASLQTEDGRAIQCIRRKGRKATLRAADDTTVLDEATLSDLLAGVDADSFRARFGIDYAELVAGGEAIVQGHGDLGKILFAAASGLAGLGRIQKALLEEAQQLFKPRGSTQPINVAVSRWNEVKKQIRQHQLSATEWTRHDQQLGDAQQQREAVDASLQELATAARRLERLEQALPMIARRRDWRAQLADAPLSGAVALTEDFSSRRQTLVGDRLVAQNEHRAATEDLELINQERSQLNLPEPLLARTEQIDRLRDDLGSVHKAARDRLGLVKQQAELRREIDAMLRNQLGREPGDDAAESLAVRADQRERIKALSSQLRGLHAERENAVRQLADWHQRSSQLREQFQQLPPPLDPAPLREALDQARTHGDVDTALERARADLESRIEQVNLDLTRLGGFDGSLADLESLPVPEEGTVDGFVERMEQLEHQRRSLREQTAELDDDLETRRQRIEHLRQSHDVPHQADVDRARQSRDEGWKLVVQQWLEDGADPKRQAEFIAAHLSELSAAGSPSDPRSLAAAMERAIETADGWADRLRREAERVAQVETQQAECDQRQRQRQRLTERAERLEREQQDEQLRWQQIWQPTGVEPGSPKAMRSWLARYGELLEQAREIRTLKAQQQQLQNHQHSCRRQLNGALEQLGLGGISEAREGEAPAEPPAQSRSVASQSVAPHQSLAALITAATRTLNGLEEDQRRRQRLTDEIDGVQLQFPKLDQQLQQANDQWSQWQQEWAKATQPLALRNEATPEEASAMIQAIDQLQSKMLQLEREQRRIRSIDRDADRFDQQLQSICEAVATDLLDRDAEHAARELVQRAEQARADRQRLEQLNARASRAEEKQIAAQRQLRLLDESLAALCAEAKADQVEQLPELERLGRRRQTLEQQLDDIEGQLLQLAAGQSLDDFITESESVDPNTLPAQLDQLGRQRDTLDVQRGELDQQIGQLRTELQQMDGGDEAARLSEESQSLVAELRDDCRQYARLRLASAVLRQSIERYRQRHQGPVLQRASELFAELTGGSFAQLRADYDDRGEAVLVGVRPEQAGVVGVEGMSDGTCDQLYLALRLASLEHHLDHHPPLPFVVDDILINFDDDRSIAALRALARLAERTQVIFFTHHEHLLRLADEHLHEDQFHIVHLGDASAVETPQPLPG